MSSNGSGQAGKVGAVTQDVRRPGPVVDEIDHRILNLLAADARMPNNALAAEVGIAPSTCLGRVRALRESGVIRGYHADIDQAALGRPMQAMISVRIQSGARERIGAFLDRIRRRPEVHSVYFLSGADDFLLHVGTADAHMLRDFVVDQLSVHPEIALTETNLIFEHYRGEATGF